MDLGGGSGGGSSNSSSSGDFGCFRARCRRNRVVELELFGC